MLILKNNFFRAVLPIGVTVLILAWIFYLAAVKYLISPIEEVAPESVREMRIKKQLNDIEIARQKVQEDYRLNKSSAEQLAELGNKSQETNTKPLSEEDINNQLQALDKLRNK